MKVGTRVEVRNRFDAHWSRGFEVAESIADDRQYTYRVKRRSDGSVLPAVFDEEDLREERRRQMWWG